MRKSKGSIRREIKQTAFNRFIGNGENGRATYRSADHLSLTEIDQFKTAKAVNTSA